MIVLSFLILFSFNINANIIAPSFDPGVDTYLPSAVALDKIMSGSLILFRGSGDEKDTNSFSHRPGESEVKKSGLRINLKSGLGIGAIEFNYRKKSEDYFKVPVTNTKNTDDETSSNEFKLNLGIGKIYGGYFGINYFSKSEEIKIFTQEIKTSGFGLGLNYVFMSHFIFGLGQRLVSQQGTRRVNNQWFERVLGVAYVENSATMKYLFELSLINSPRRKRKAGSDKTINHHRKADTFNLKLEAKTANQLFMAFGYESKKEEAPSENTVDLAMKNLTFGIGSTFYGILSNFYFISSSRDYADGTYEGKRKTFMLSFTYLLSNTEGR